MSDSGVDPLFGSTTRPSVNMLNMRGVPNPSLAVGSPTRTRNTTPSQRIGASPSRALLQSRAMVGTPRPVHSPVRPPPAEFQPPREGYSVKYGHMNDAYIERGDCSLITKILDGKLNVSDAFDVLKSADLKDAFLFLKSNRGSRFVREAMEAAPNSKFSRQLAGLIVCNKLVCDLAFDQSGNFVVQLIPGKISREIDEELCAQLTEGMPELTMDKYGCRVVQAAFKEVSPDLVEKMVFALRGYELRACQDKNGTHVIQCLLDVHHYPVFENFLRPFTNRDMLREIMEDQHGCRIVQKCLESLIREIKVDFVPPILNSLIITILRDADRYVENEYANYVIQKVIKNPALKRQRDYVIDYVLLGRLLHLSQGKFPSHVVEAALEVAPPIRLTRMCNEIFYDYKPNEKGFSPLEVMLFDQYANYVAQKLLSIAIDVHGGCRLGDPKWIYILANTVDKNKERLCRYSSGKKIIETLEQVRPSLYGNRGGLFSSYFNQ